MFTAAAAASLCEKLKLDLPIIKAVAAILAGKITAKEAVDSLLSIPVGEELPTAIFGQEIK